MNIFTGLLFNQGHIQDPELARSLAQAPSPDTDAGGDGDAAAEAERKPPRVRRGSGWEIGRASCRERV